MSIYKYMDVSTGHVMQSDMDFLEQQIGNGNPVIAYCYEHGAFVPLCQDMDNGLEYRRMRLYGYSEAFIKLVQLAMDKEVYMLRIDADGAHWDELETFEW